MRGTAGLMIAVMALVAGSVSPDALAQQRPGVDVIPAPARVQWGTGGFAVRADTGISIPRDPGAARAARYFSDLLARTRGIQLKAVPHSGVNSARDLITFQLTPASAAAPEGYTLDVQSDRIVASASDPRGLLYAAVTLWQLCTPAAGGEGVAAAASIDVPIMRIVDAPRFRWRGLMLDSARHFQSPQFIMQLIDWMALHKLNVLQWHLTDDQAWRLEIRRYPRLTSVGAWRVPAGAAYAADIDPTTGHARLYGGYYSQATVRDIVAHAALRNVTIVPEIDMPGHATAAIVAYPRLGTVQPAPAAVPSDWGVYGNLYNAEPQTFQFLENVLAEVLQLFPSRYIHVGGDEAVKDQWRASAQVQRRMRELGAADEEALQSYFVHRMERFLTRHGRRLIGWDEILKGGMSPEATVMSWHGIDGAVTAANAGHDAVLSPAPTLYFDNIQGNLPHEPPGRGNLIRLEDVYRFDPLPASLSGDQQRHVLGLQASLWTEHIRTQERVEFMAFPRAAAVAELGWSAADKLQWDSFVARLLVELRRYQLLGIHASEDLFAVAVNATLDRAHAQVRLQLSTQGGLGDIHYTLDGSEPLASSAIYTGPFVTAASGQIRASSFLGGRELVPSRARALDVASLQTRSSHELKTCSGKVLLSLEDDAPLQGDRAVFLVDIMNPCWIYQAADLTHVSAVAAAVGQLPFNFQLGADVNSIRLLPPRTPTGELEVRLDGCEGEPIASLSLQPALANDAVTSLPAAAIGHHEGQHDLCLRFTQRSLDPLWVIDQVRLLE
jgi:hexosaminidase